MNLHRNNAKIRRQTLQGMAFGVLVVAVPWLVGLLGREFFLGPWVWYGIGGLITLVSLLVFVMSFMPFRFILSEEGVTVRADSLNATLPWSAVHALTLEHAPGTEPKESPRLVLWPMPGTAVTGKPRVHRDGQAGYPILDLDDFTESAADVQAALSRYAGAKFIDLAVVS
jgi:hypothetical protein